MTMTASKLMYEGIQRVLLGRFPELGGRVEKAFGSYYDLQAETPEAYPLFEDALQGFVLQLLETGQNDQLLRRIFAFFEEMADSSDRNVVDLLSIAILEALVFRRESVLRAWGYMGEKTKELASETARSLGRQENLPP